MNGRRTWRFRELTFVRSSHLCARNEEYKISHFVAGLPRETTAVDSMVACDHAATQNSGSPAHFGSHPTFTRVVHFWKRFSRWRSNRRLLKKMISRRLFKIGEQQRDRRVTRPDFRVLFAGTDLSSGARFGGLERPLLPTHERYTSLRSTVCRIFLGA